jgi:hypothetical protein
VVKVEIKSQRCYVFKNGGSTILWGSHGKVVPSPLGGFHRNLIVKPVLKPQALFGRAPALAPPPAPAGALPNAKNDSSSGGGAPDFPLTGAVWARRSHKSVASSGSASPFPASPPGGACWSTAKDVGARGRSEKREARRRQAAEGRARSARQGRAAGPAAAVVPAARAGRRPRSTCGEKEEEDEKPTVAGSRRRLRIQATASVLPGGRPSWTASGRRMVGAPLRRYA